MSVTNIKWKTAAISMHFSLIQYASLHWSITIPSYVHNFHTQWLSTSVAPSYVCRVLKKGKRHFLHFKNSNYKHNCIFFHVFNAVFLKCQRKEFFCKFKSFDQKKKGKLKIDTHSTETRRFIHVLSVKNWNYIYIYVFMCLCYLHSHLHNSDWKNKHRRVIEKFSAPETTEQSLVK